MTTRMKFLTATVIGIPSIMTALQLAPPTHSLVAGPDGSSYYLNWGALGVTLWCSFWLIRHLLSSHSREREEWRDALLSEMKENREIQRQTNEIVKVDLEARGKLYGMIDRLLGQRFCPYAGNLEDHPSNR